MTGILPVLVTAIGIATALNVALKKIGIPTVIGYIFTGAIIGSAFDIHVHGNEQLEHIAEFGIVFLMFTIGLEFSVSHLNKMKKEVFVYGLLQVFVTGGVLAVAAHFVLGVDIKSATLVGAGLALSSTAIVLKMLNESGKAKDDYGRNSVGILIFQDLAVIPILLMVTIFTNEDKAVSELLTDTAINALIVVGSLVAVGRLLLSHFFKAVSSTMSKEIYMGSILLTVVGAAYFAHNMGFSYSLGAFIAGMMIADTIYKYQVEADLIPFRDLLLGVFFVSVGLQIDAGVVVDNIGWIMLLGVSVMLIKGLVLFAILVIFDKKKTAAKTSLGLAEIGEFALVVFSLLLANEMLEQRLVQIFMVTVVLSMIATPFILNNIDSLIDRVFKGDIKDSLATVAGAAGGRVILCGYGSFGRTVSTRLDAAKIDHVIVTDNTDTYVSAKEAGRNVVFGDPAAHVLLESLRIKEAMGTVIAMDDFEQAKQTMASITLYDPDIKVLARVAREEDKHELSEFSHELLVDGNTHTAALVVDQISRSKLLAQETSSLKFLGDYTAENPAAALALIVQEQARLLEISSGTFNALREEKDILYIKALHDSFEVLSEIVGRAIADLTKKATLSTKEYEQVSTLLDNQKQLVTMNSAIVDLAQTLKKLESVEETKKFSQMVVEGLDTILLSLKDIAADFNEDDMTILSSLTKSDGGGLERIRQSYLGDEKELDQDTKVSVLDSTNQMTELRALFRSIGENYRKLSTAVAHS